MFQELKKIRLYHIYLLIDQDLQDIEIYIETPMVRVNIELYEIQPTKHEKRLYEPIVLRTEKFPNNKLKECMHFVRNQNDQ